MIARSSRWTLLVTLLAAAATPAAAAEPVEAVDTPGTATLTMCREWVVYDSCSTYHNVPVPSVIAIGDKVHVRFGSNPKSYDFHVIAVHPHGDGCTIVSDHTGAGESGEKLQIDTCRPAAKPADR